MKVVVKRSTIDYGSYLEHSIEYADGSRLTYSEHRRREPQPVGSEAMHRIGAAAIARLEADAPTRQAAEDLVTEWDRTWRVS